MTNITKSIPNPFVIELNGVNFKEFTKDIRKPIDGVFAAATQSTMRELCENIPGCTFGMTEYGRIVLCISGTEAAAKEDYAALATKLFRQEFRIAVENWILDEGIRMSMDAPQHDPHSCPNEEVLRLKEVYLSMFDKGEFEACICTGSTPKWYIGGLGKVDTRLYLFCRMQNLSLGIRGICCYQMEKSKVAKEVPPVLSLPDWYTHEELEAARKRSADLLEKYPPMAKLNVKPGMEWVIDLNPPYFRIDKDYILRWF